MTSGAERTAEPDEPSGTNPRRPPAYRKSGMTSGTYGTSPDQAQTPRPPRATATHSDVPEIIPDFRYRNPGPMGTRPRRQASSSRSSTMPVNVPWVVLPMTDAATRPSRSRTIVLGMALGGRVLWKTSCSEPSGSLRLG